MIMIFEDNLNMSVSQLLRESMLGSFIVFSEGNSKLYSKVCEYQHEDYILIFMDVIPNNSSVMREYKKLIRKLSDNFSERCGKSIFLVPLFCIEYILLQYLNEILQNSQLANFLSSYKLPLDIKGYGQLKDASGKVIRKANDLATFEKQCKAVLAYLTDETLPVVFGKFIGAKNMSIQSIQKINFGESACFYTCSCDSCKKRCALVSAGCIEKKANMLYTRLPVFFSCKELRECIDRQLREKESWGALHDFILQQYDKLYISFGGWWSEKRGQPVEILNWENLQLLF